MHNAFPGSETGGEALFEGSLAWFGLLSAPLTRNGDRERGGALAVPLEASLGCNRKPGQHGDEAAVREHGDPLLGL